MMISIKAFAVFIWIFCYVIMMHVMLNTYNCTGKVSNIMNQCRDALKIMMWAYTLAIIDILVLNIWG